MIIREPCCITSRLLPGVMVDGVEVSIEYSKEPGESRRVRYRYYIDDGPREYQADDLQSGAGGGNLQAGLENLLAFLGAAGEAYNYKMRTGEESDNGDLFPDWVSEWAYQNDDELSMIGIELRESENIIEEG